jgi:hypothetical protein
MSSENDFQPATSFIATRQPALKKIDTFGSILPGRAALQELTHQVVNPEAISLQNSGLLTASRYDAEGCAHSSVLANAYSGMQSSRLSEQQGNAVSTPLVASDPQLHDRPDLALASPASAPADTPSGSALDGLPTPDHEDGGHHSGTLKVKKPSQCMLRFIKNRMSNHQRI